MKQKKTQQPKKNSAVPTKKEENSRLPNLSPPRKLQSQHRVSQNEDTAQTRVGGGVFISPFSPCLWTTSQQKTLYMNIKIFHMEYQYMHERVPIYYIEYLFILYRVPKFTI